MRELSQHAASSDQRAEVGTRAASSVSVGEVSSRTHSEGESEDHFESSSREFANPNRCHAVTYYFYQINKTQTVRFSIVAIQRRVIDPAAVEQIGRASELARVRSDNVGLQSTAAASTNRQASRAATLEVKPIPEALKVKALAQVDQALVRQGLLDKSGKVADSAVSSLSFERTSSIPTPGMLVKGCLDECDTCEPASERAIELENKQLQNDLLRKQIELLDKSQQYRCCPAGEAATAVDAAAM